MITPVLPQPECSNRRRPVSVKNLLRVAHHVDAKKVYSSHDLQTFTARFLAFRPAWVSALYRLRPLLLRAFGVASEHVPEQGYIRPEDVRYEIGQKVWFFTVRGGEPNHRIILRASNSLLIAYLVIERAIGPDLPAGEAEYILTTIVRHRNVAGRLYFMLILPFHHMVVRSAMNAAAQPIENAALEMQHRRPTMGFISISEARRRK